jgi:hypothetical protein
MLGEGHLCLFGTLEIGHTVHKGVQRLQCWPFPDQKYCGFNREDCVFVRPPGVEKFSLGPGNVWYGRLKDDPVQLECAYISFFYDIRLEPSGEY